MTFSEYSEYISQTFAVAIISQPKAITQNNQKAYMQMANQILISVFDVSIEIDWEIEWNRTNRHIPSGKFP